MPTSMTYGVAEMKREETWYEGFNDIEFFGDHIVYSPRHGRSQEVQFNKSGQRIDTELQPALLFENDIPVGLNMLNIQRLGFTLVPRTLRSCSSPA